MSLSGVVTLLSLLVVCHGAINLNNIIFGTCVEMCSNSLIIRAVGGIGGCAEGYECRSNGCGHTCQPVLVKQIAVMCPAIGCALFCPSGYATLANGCPSCTCL
ncbi:unnamed protein product [Lymnaea stagnalis]|uniref:Antistasin-like domain-containing protein n=1 Tax=Lymnaea stagnalis TaxID=6523 RepID=A0AAV2IKS8_LYMST